jgi:hypothetical protein
MYFFIPLKIPKNRSEHNCLISIVHIKSMVTNCGYAKESYFLSPPMGMGPRKTTTMVEHNRIKSRAPRALKNPVSRFNSIFSSEC